MKRQLQTCQWMLSPPLLPENLLSHPRPAHCLFNLDLPTSTLLSFSFDLGLILPYAMHHRCLHCDTATTTTWRSGPAGLKTLCNRCSKTRPGRRTNQMSPQQGFFPPSDNPNAPPAASGRAAAAGAFTTAGATTTTASKPEAVSTKAAPTTGATMQAGGAAAVGAAASAAAAGTTAAGTTTSDPPNATGAGGRAAAASRAAATPSRGLPPRSARRQPRVHWPLALLPPPRHQAQPGEARQPLALSPRSLSPRTPPPPTSPQTGKVSPLVRLCVRWRLPSERLNPLLKLGGPTAARVLLLLGHFLFRHGCPYVTFHRRLGLHGAVCFF